MEKFLQDNLPHRIFNIFCERFCHLIYTANIAITVGISIIFTTETRVEKC